MINTDENYVYSKVKQQVLDNYIKYCNDYHVNYPPKKLKGLIDDFKSKILLLGLNLEYDFTIVNDKVYLVNLNAAEEYVTIPDFVFGITSLSKINITNKDLYNLRVEFNRPLAVLPIQDFNELESLGSIKSKIDENIEYLRYLNLFDDICNYNDFSPLINSDEANKARIILFYSIWNVTNIELIGFKTDLMVSLHKLLSGNRLLREIDFGEDFDMSTIISISHIFSNNESLTKIKTGSKRTIDASNLMFMDEAFYQTNIPKIDFNDFIIKHIRSLERTFLYSNVQEINFGNNFDTRELKSLELTFYATQNLKKINFGEKFKLPMVENLSYAFCRNTAIKEFNSKDFGEMPNILVMVGMFSGCKYLKKVDFTTMRVDKCISIASLFNECSELEEVKFGENFIPKTVNDTSKMFYKCRSIESIDLGDNFDTSNVADMSLMFSRCIKLKRLNLGKSFRTYRCKEFMSMFYDCRSLEELDLGDRFNILHAEIIKQMFFDCVSLRKLVIPENFRYTTETIKDVVFRYTYDLKDVRVKARNNEKENDIIKTLINMGLTPDNLDNLQIIR